MKEMIQAGNFYDSLEEKDKKDSVRRSLPDPRKSAV